MIIAYQGEWPNLAKNEQHALSQARVLLPASDTCFYIGFPWRCLAVALQDNDERKVAELSRQARALLPKSQPGNRLITIVSSDDDDVVRYIRKLGIEFIFSVTSENEVFALQPIMTLFVDGTEYPQGLGTVEKLLAEREFATGNFQDSLFYLAQLLARPNHKLCKPAKASKIPFYLFGDHSHRTPLSYCDYWSSVTPYLHRVDNVDDAKLLITGNRVDYFRQIDTVAKWQSKDPERRVILISEEPYWDTMWDKEFTKHSSTRRAASGDVIIERYNHWTSDVFNWQYLPYYLTTDTHFFARYSELFNRNKKMTADDWLAHWQSCRYPSAFIAEKRDEERFNVSFPELDVHSDCVLRTELAKNAQKKGGFIEGKGWNSGADKPRQQLEDWHLDKMEKLNRNSYVISAIENTHQKNYVTEKLFDAYALGGVPLYSANPETHSVWRLVEHDSLINVYGLSLSKAQKTLDSFKVDKAFAESYVRTQQRLAKLFSEPWRLWYERKRIAGIIAKQLK